MTAMPVLLAILLIMAIAYRYYSAFLAARVAVLDDARVTPAVRLNDGQNFHPTNKWVLFGHHFAAISGAGPLIGPVLAAQFGYMPGLLWILIGVCLGGAAQDFLVLAASTRRNGKSLAQMAYTDIGRLAGTAGTAAILFILVIALAGLGKVVVKALGGEEVRYGDTKLVLPAGAALKPAGGPNEYEVPAGTVHDWAVSKITVTKPFTIKAPAELKPAADGVTVALPKGTVRKVPGSSWGTFTIAATIPIALFVGLYMYKIRPGKVTEASLIGAVLTLGATVAGGWVAEHHIGEWFNLTGTQVTWAMAIYGFVAAVLPVWVLLAPRDYLSSFLKIGTIAMLVVGVLVANPRLETPAVNSTFLGGGPIVPGTIFPFLFITVMCGALSGFHALVSSGTTSKMIAAESQARMVGYGAMLIEGLVAVVAMIAAASLTPVDYYAMNTELSRVPAFHDRILTVGGAHGLADVNPAGNIDRYEDLTGEALRGRTGGAVTLAVGMAHIFEDAARTFGVSAQHALDAMWKYWFHFAIMFEALFILTTIDAGTRIGRFLVQEVGGKIHPALGRTNWWVSGWLATGLVVAGWALFMSSDSFDVIWVMFGIANQTLAVIALSVIAAYLANEGRARFAWVAFGPMAVIVVTTGSAASVMLTRQFNTLGVQIDKGTLLGKDGLMAMLLTALILAMLACAGIVIVQSALRVRAALKGNVRPAEGFEVVPANPAV
ncbi:MAG TPA: carbon starvation protein A [Humisphaera sp.]